MKNKTINILFTVYSVLQIIHSVSQFSSFEFFISFFIYLIRILIKKYILIHWQQKIHIALYKKKLYKTIFCNVMASVCFFFKGLIGKYNGGHCNQWVIFLGKWQISHSRPHGGGFIQMQVRKTDSVNDRKGKVNQLLIILLTQNPMVWEGHVRDWGHVGWLENS